MCLFAGASSKVCGKSAILDERENIFPAIKDERRKKKLIDVPLP
jgi:hypothetical protein